MTDVTSFGLLIAVVCIGLLLAVLSNRLTERIRTPAPALFLVVAAVASDLVPDLGQLSIPVVQGVVSIALAVILFDGGMHLGWRRFRENAAAITLLGVLGTLVTAGALALVAHWLLGFDWVLALMLATALAPTDPAVVFSVLGRREIAGRTGDLLEGESGANDPVGIAIMVALVGASSLSGIGAVAFGVGEFALQMGIGAAVGVAGGIGLLAFMRHVALPAEGLYSIRTLAGAGAIFGVATVAHGSGFLAVFVAGIVIGDERAPFKREIERFHSALASLGEIVAFTVLGLTVSVAGLTAGYAWLVGLILAVLLGFVVRPLLVGLVSLPVRLQVNERAFVLWSGLKGAVPILLGTYILASGLAGATRAYAVIIVVVAFSVIVQGGLVPVVARGLGLSVRTVHPEPWTLGVRFRHEPDGLHRFLVASGSVADGCEIADLPLSEDAWVSMVSRRGRLVQVRAGTVLRSGDEVLVFTDEETSRLVADVFAQDAEPGPEAR